jgi:transcriptional regulator with XRE-family HTH domain
MDHPHDRLEPTFIARLIDERRKERGLSIRSAAEESSISEGRWRQIAKGYQQMSGGVRAPVNAPPETLARMAAAVRFEASNLERQLSEAGGLDELAQKVIRRMQLAEAARNYRGSVFGFGLDTPDRD